MVENEKTILTEDPSNIEFKTNPGLEAALTHIQEGAAHIDWETIVANATALLKKAPEYTSISVQDLLVGAYIIDRLTHMTETNVILDPIPDKTQTANYAFNHGKPFGTILPLNDTPAELLVPSESTLLTEIDGLPTVWLFFLRNGANKGSDERIFAPTSTNQRFDPLRKHYGQNNFGYVVVSLPGIFEQSPNHEKFINNGGKHLALFSAKELYNPAVAFSKKNRQK